MQSNAVVLGTKVPSRGGLHKVALRFKEKGANSRSAKAIGCAVQRAARDCREVGRAAQGMTRIPRRPGGQHPFHWTAMDNPTYCHFKHQHDACQVAPGSILAVLPARQAKPDSLRGQRPQHRRLSSNEVPQGVIRRLFRHYFLQCLQCYEVAAVVSSHWLCWSHLS